MSTYKIFEGVLKFVVKSVEKEGVIQFQCFFLFEYVLCEKKHIKNMHFM